jgi:uncharacterized protein
MTKKSSHGFANWDKARHQAVSSAGGKAVHAQGKGHEFTVEEARAAGRLGGVATHQKKCAGRAVGELPAVGAEDGSAGSASGE